MKIVMRLLTTLCAIALAPSASLAASSEWIGVQGGRVRIVTAGAPDAQGMLKGALDIELKPGWKTYWRDPGDAGVPPMIDVSKSINVESAAFDFPAPERHVETDFTWAGYSMPVALPIVFKLDDPAMDAMIEADVFLGICKDICIPVQAALKLDAAGVADSPGDEALVAASFEALPAEAHDGFQVLPPTMDGDRATFVVELPAGTKAVDLFLAAADGYAFATPEKSERDGKTVFSMKVTRPEAAPPAGALHYTLVGDTGAVSGTLPYF